MSERVWRTGGLGAHRTRRTRVLHARAAREFYRVLVQHILGRPLRPCERAQRGRVRAVGGRDLAGRRWVALGGRRAGRQGSDRARDSCSFFGSAAAEEAAGAAHLSGVLGRADARRAPPHAARARAHCHSPPTSHSGDLVLGLRAEVGCPRAVRGSLAETRAPISDGPTRGGSPVFNSKLSSRCRS